MKKLQSLVLVFALLLSCVVLCAEAKARMPSCAAERSRLARPTS